MSDPLSHVVQLLKPRAVFAKGISGAGDWAVQYSEFGQPSFCAVVQGACRLRVQEQAAIDLHAGDFVLLPATPGFVLSAGEAVAPSAIDPHQSAALLDGIRHGRQQGPPDVQLLGGWFQFDAADPAMLVSLLPSLIHVRDVPRLGQLVQWLGEESRRDGPGRHAVQSRLVELLLVEALRASPDHSAPGLLRGLADARLAPALKQMHEQPAHGWTVEALAKLAALSRSAFFDRFLRQVGVAPMEYLLGWRMSLARDLLRQPQANLAEVAERVGYASASTFSTAFRRRVGIAPGQFARSQ